MMQNTISRDTDNNCHKIPMNISHSSNKIRRTNRFSASMNFLLALTVVASISSTAGFVIPATLKLNRGSTLYFPPNGSDQTSEKILNNFINQDRRCTQCQMVVTDVETILGGSTFGRDGFSSRDSVYSQFPLNAADRQRKKNGRTRMTSSNARQKAAAKTLKLVEPKLKASDPKAQRRKTSRTLKSKRSTTPTIDANKKYQQISALTPFTPSTNPPLAHTFKSTVKTPTKKTVVNTESIINKGDDGEKSKATTALLTTTEKTTDAKKNTKSRSSTMPGLAYKNTMRIKAYEDGMDIAEKRSGRKIRAHKSVSKNKDSKRKLHSEQMYGSSVSVPDSLIQFVDEIHQESRITPQEEIELGSKTQEAIRLLNLHENLADKLNRLPTDAEYCAAAGKINIESLRQTIEEGNEAKNRLVTSNLRMVQRVVNLYLRNGLGSEYNAGDLMQDGTVALIRAAEKFEPQRGFRFSTYAMYWIRSSVKRSQILQSRVIDVPQRLHENYKKIQKFIKEYEDSFGYRPEVKEIAEAVRLTEAQVERCVKALEQRIYSLDAEITNPLKTGTGKGSSDRKENMYNLIHNKFDDVEMTTIERKFMKEDLIRSLRKHLTPHEVDLLLLRYGLIDEKTLPHGFSGPLTISEVSRLVGIKPDKVRRMLNNSLKQLRHVMSQEWENEVL